MPSPEISIVIANWNGLATLEECVATLWRSAEATGCPFELIVVDDVSQDGSPDLLRARFPQVRLLRNARNLGFARTSNRGAREARGRILVMMNNDMRVPPDFLPRLIAPFTEPQPPDAAPLFAVGAKTIDWRTGAPNHLCMSAAWRRGALDREWSDPPHRVETTYVQGGSAAFDREKFLQLGGFDPLFAPGYWEDYDLTYRAAKTGWRVLYEPAAVADHMGQASMARRYQRDRLEQITERNRLWFTWLNLDDRRLLARHLLALPWVYTRDLLRGRGLNPLRGLLRALRRLRKVRRLRRLRRQAAPPALRSDRDLLALTRELVKYR